MSEAVVLRSFVGGELAPALAVRADLAKYQTGLRTCRNFIVQRSGGAANRSGTRFVNAAKDNTAGKRLFRFVSDVPEESILVEAGENYIRFYQGGALVAVDLGDVDDYDGGTDYVIGDLVKDSGSIFYAVAASTGESTGDADFWSELPGGILEIPTPFDSPRLFNWSQSGHVVTITHRDQPPHELIFEAIDRWVFRPVNTSPQVLPPENVVLTPSSGLRKFGYVVTSAHPITYEESIASTQAIDASAAEPTEDAPHVLNWDAQNVNGDAVPEYYVYCDPYGNGTYGLIGVATGGTTFRNPGLTPDFTQTPPIPVILFAEEGTYPHVSATYQQRRIFAQTATVPDDVRASRVGFASNFGVSSPLQDDDAIQFKIAGNSNHAVRALVALKTGLVVMTSSGEWTVRGGDGRTLIPNGIEPEQELYAGIAEDIPPVPVGNGIIYVQARGSQVRDVNFDQGVNGLAGRDLTLLASHLFDGRTIVAIDYAMTPHSIIWCVRSDGVLLGLTYIPDQDVWGWHRHDTPNGIIEDVCVVPEVGEDAVYFLVAREINGGVVRYIEKLAPRTIVDYNRDVFFLDCGLSYSGAPANDFAGLDHLEGETVGAVGDGQYLGTFVVSSGVVTLPGDYSDVHIGLLYTSDLETLDLDVAGSTIRDKRKIVQSLTLILDASVRQYQAGPDVNNLAPATVADFEGADPFSGSHELSTFGAYNAAGRTFIRQAVPLPIAVLGIIPQVDIGG